MVFVPIRLGRPLGKQRKWTEEKIIATLKELHSNGENIRPGSLSTHYPGLWAAGKRLFGNSHNMYRAAGFNRDDLNIRKQGYWTEERIGRAIQERFYQGKEMSRRALIIEDRFLLGAADKKLGGWYKALNLYGIPHQSKRREWTEEKVKEAILARHASRKNMKCEAVRKDDSGLLSAAISRYGSWYNALDSCGVPFVRKRNWTPEKVKEEILARQMTGKGMSESAILKDDYGLVRAAYRAFGTWYDALKTLGIPYDHVKDIHPVGWTKESIMSTLKELQSKGEDIRPATLKARHYSLYKSSLEKFGNIAELFRAAGLDLSKFVVRRAWTEEEDEFLRRNYKTMNRAEICRTLGRPPSGVIHRIVRLGLSKTGQIPWTDEELKVLSDPSLTSSEKKERLPKRAIERIRSEMMSRELTSKPESKVVEYASGDYVRMIGGDSHTDFAERRSRIVASQTLGRSLRKNEIVHHINMDKRDDRPENLLVCPRSDHLAVHGSLNRLVGRLLEMKILEFHDDSGYAVGPGGIQWIDTGSMFDPPLKKLRYSMVRVDGRLLKRNRIVAAEKLGRPLRDDEVVHHINMNSKDDRPENLAIVQHSKHTWIHKTLDKLVKQLMDSNVVEFNRESNQYFLKGV